MTLCVRGGEGKGGLLQQRDVEIEGKADENSGARSDGRASLFIIFLFPLSFSKRSAFLLATWNLNVRKKSAAE